MPLGLFCAAQKAELSIKAFFSQVINCFYFVNWLRFQ
jgi:hypothetical protein